MKDDLNRVEELTKSLQGIKRAEAGPYFYSKLMNRIENKNEAPVKYRLVMPAWSLFMVLFLLITFNLFTYIQVKKTAEAEIQNTDSEYTLTEMNY